MLEKRTVLVLGAGASAPYGFPVGERLFYEVVEQTGRQDSDAFKVLRGLDYAPAAIALFREALRKSGALSVDAFLEHRREYESLGKDAMAAVLIRQEATDRLFPHAPTQGDWYKCLCNELIEGGQLPQKGILLVITFNYDRSLEHYLHTALKNLFRYTDSECATALQAVEIVHVHGDLGNLPWQEERTGEHRTREYTPEFTPEAVRAAARGIRIVHEVKPNDEPFGRAHDLIAQAERLCFLGFGYHQDNVNRLGLGRLPRNAKVFRPTFGMGEAEHQQAVSRVDKAARGHTFWPGDDPMRTTEGGILEFLRDVAVFE
jgi:hypothetical protein